MRNRNKIRIVTVMEFEGIAMDGGFVFTACCSESQIFSLYSVKMQKFLAAHNVEELVPYAGFNAYFLEVSGMQSSKVKVISYADGTLEVEFDSAESIPKVAKLVAGMLSKYSNFAGLDAVILNYRGICLKIVKDTGRKNIIAMIKRAMATSKYQSSNHDGVVDFTLVGVPKDVEKVDFVEIPDWNVTRKVLLFKSRETGKNLYLAEIKDGVITPDFTNGSKISELIQETKKVFKPVSNLYGIKGVELQMNHFEYRMKKGSDVGKIYALFQRAMWVDTAMM